MAVQTFHELSDDFLDQDKLKFFITPKWSQDHLETFLGVTSSMGFNDNPSGKQFIHMCRCLLEHNEIHRGV